MNKNIITTEDVIVPNNIPGIGYNYFNKMKEHASQNKIAQIVEKTDEKVSFESLLKRCIRTSMFLQKNGIKKDDVIALFGPKHVHSVVSFISSHFIGAIPTCVAYDYPENDIKIILKSIEPKIIFTDSKCLTVLKEYLRDIGLSAKFIVFGDCEEGFNFFDIIKPQAGEENFEPVKIDNIKNTAIIYYSSGTTGPPKPICISHYAMLANVINSFPKEPDMEVLNHYQKQFSNGFRFLDHLPLYWISGELSGWIQNGSTRILVEKFEALKFWEIVDKYKVNMTFIAPNSLMELSKCPKSEHLNVDSLCLIIVGGFHAKEECLAAVRKMMHPLSAVIPGYGQTELNGGTILFDVRDKKQGKYLNEKPKSVGMVVKGLSVKVVDLDTNEILGPNKSGEILMKGETCFNGYYKMDSKDCFDEDGYFRTGDIGYYDEDKCFYIVDRLKGIFRYSNFPKIASSNIEKIIMKHPAVKRAAVFGYPHPIDQNHVTAVVVLEENAQATSEEIRNFVDSQIEDYKRLRGGLKIVKELPLTLTGKIKTGDLKALVDGNLSSSSLFTD
ncbi:unnamed protein product [Brassicogethes aeneus]|uniref:Uncharacterized protein n=1 Tax=Brassicogethes aeneus TaxID=1431903 RepID=A0A9P0AT25_BRAAE|nr:unnamed protein product [Brassicogethes aeneus]